MSVVLSVAVGAITALLGVNLLVKAAEDADRERKALRGLPGRDLLRANRLWTNRLLGALFIGFGLALAAPAVF